MMAREVTGIHSMGGEDGVGDRHQQLCDPPEGEICHVLIDWESVTLRGTRKFRLEVRKPVVGIMCDDFKVFLKDEYSPNNEMHKLENEFWYHTMMGAGHAAYTDRFHELDKLIPHLVNPESKRIERYIYRIALEIFGMVQVTKPSTIQSAILKDRGLIDDAVRNGTLSKSGDKSKRCE
ncbi:hypothetical protein Tco_1024228 [Tanacetum coccineum]